MMSMKAPDDSRPQWHHVPIMHLFAAAPEPSSPSHPPWEECCESEVKVGSRNDTNRTRAKLAATLYPLLDICHRKDCDRDGGTTQDKRGGLERASTTEWPHASLGWVDKSESEGGVL